MIEPDNLKRHAIMRSYSSISLFEPKDKLISCAKQTIDA